MDEDTDRSGGLDARQWDSVYRLVHEALRERAAEVGATGDGLGDVRGPDDDRHDVANEALDHTVVPKNRR